LISCFRLPARRAIFFEGKHQYPIHYVGNPTVDEVAAYQAAHPKNKEHFIKRKNGEKLIYISFYILDTVFFPRPYLRRNIIVNRYLCVGGTMVKHYKELAYMGFIPVLLHLRTIFANMKRSCFLFQLSNFN